MSSKKLQIVGNLGNDIVVDAALSDTSENPVQNKVIKDALDDKANASHIHSYDDLTNTPTPLIGTINEITPQQAYEVIISGRQVVLTAPVPNDDADTVLFNSFQINWQTEIPYIFSYMENDIGERWNLYGSLDSGGSWDMLPALDTAADKYLPLSGGNLTNDLHVDGSISTNTALNINNGDPNSGGVYFALCGNRDDGYVLDILGQENDELVRVQGVDTPQYENDAANKGYVDSKVDSKVYVQNDEPTDAPEGAIWVDMDENIGPLSYAEEVDF